MPWDDGLNEPFLTIAQWPDSPIRVLAGPGTGKTFALMRRVARILEEGNPPDRLLVVTFTRTAAKDLVRQLESLNVPGANRVTVATLHSTCFQMLNRGRVLAVTGRTPRTLVDFEKEFLLIDLQDPRFEGKREKRRRLRAFEAAWARLQTEEPGWPRDRVDRAFGRALLGWLHFHEAMVVGELVPETLRYLRSNPACRERRQLAFLIVDEYQDLNKAEQVLLDVLGEHANMCVVGDDDQSIYGFKYAHPEGIVEFPQTHPGTHEETITVCRRCPRVVVHMGNALIRENPRTQRHLRPRQGAPEGEAWAIQWDSLEAEGRGLAATIEHSVRVRDIPPEEIIVLTARRLIGYRVRDELRSRNIPVRSFFNEQALDNDASQERFTLLNLLAGPDDRVALRCWLGFDSRNGVPGTYSQLRRHCEHTGEQPRRVLEDLAAGRLDLPRTRRLIERYNSLVLEIRNLQGRRGQDFVQAWLPPENTELDELRALAIQTLRVTEDPGRMFDEIRYLITQPELPESPDSVRVMSFHKSKGLTARLVILAGCMEGVIPHIDERGREPEQERQLQEQRRLFYVAITRTSEILIISAPLFIDLHTASRILALARRRHGGVIETIFTQFFAQLGQYAPVALRGNDFLEQYLRVGPAVGRP
jgi:DNA helicase-2/ATP-dependent DNA helicase PcrA